MITELMYLILFTTVCVLAYKISISEQMIFEKVGKYAQYKIEQGEEIYNLIYCEWCSPTIFTFIGWIFMYVFNVANSLSVIQLIGLHFLGWFASCFVCGFIWNVYKTMNAKKEFFESAAKYYDKAETIAHFEIKDRKNNHWKGANKSEPKSY